MGKYSKAIAAFLVSVVGLAATFGLVDDAQAQQLGVVATGLANLLAVYFVPNQ